MDINWKLLSQQLKESNYDLGFPSLRAGAALEIILGEETVRRSVDEYIADQDNILIRDVFWFIRPWSAMKYCYEISKSDAEIEYRRSAATLLITIADDRALSFVEGLLSDPEESIQKAGAELLDRLFTSRGLVFEGIVPDEAERLVQLGEAHGNGSVRELMDFIRRTIEGSRIKQ